MVGLVMSLCSMWMIKEGIHMQGLELMPIYQFLGYLAIKYTQSLN